MISKRILFVLLVPLCGACDPETVFHDVSSRQWTGLCYIQAPVILPESVEARPIKDLKFSAETFGQYAWNVPSFANGHRVAVRSKKYQVHGKELVSVQTLGGVDLVTVELTSDKKAFDIWAISGASVSGVSAESAIHLNESFGRGGQSIVTSDRMSLLTHLKSALEGATYQTDAMLTLFDQGERLKELRSDARLDSYVSQVAPAVWLHHYRAARLESKGGDAKLTNLPSSAIVYTPQDLDRYPHLQFELKKREYLLLSNSVNGRPFDGGQYFSCHLFSKEFPHTTKNILTVSSQGSAPSNNSVMSTPDEQFRDSIRDWLVASCGHQRYDAFQEATRLANVEHVRPDQLELMKQIQAWATGEAGLQRWEAYEAAANLVLKRKCSEEAAEFLRQRFRYWMSQNTWQRYDCYMSALKDAGLD